MGFRGNNPEMKDDVFGVASSKSGTFAEIKVLKTRISRVIMFDHIRKGAH